MIDDPIVEQIHRVRRRMLQECGGDLEKLAERIRAKAGERDAQLIGPEEFKKLMGRDRQPSVQGAEKAR